MLSGSGSVTRFHRNDLKRQNTHFYGDVTVQGTLLINGALAGAAGADTLPWDGATGSLQDTQQDSLLSTDGATAADFATWDAARWQKELFILMTGKWFQPAPTITISDQVTPAATRITYLSQFGAEVSPNLVNGYIGSVKFYYMRVNNSLGQAYAYNGTTQLPAGSGTNLSTLAASNLVKGSYTDWYLQDNRLYSSATTAYSVTNADPQGVVYSATGFVQENHSLRNLTAYPPQAADPGDYVAMVVIGTPTTLGTTNYYTPPVTGTATFLTGGLTDIKDNFNQVALAVKSPTVVAFGAGTSVPIPQLSIGAYCPNFRYTGSGWTLDGSITGQLAGQSRHLVWFVNDQTTKWWFPALGYDSTSSINANGDVQGAGGYISVAVESSGFGWLVPSNLPNVQVDQDCPVDLYGTSFYGGQLWANVAYYDDPNRQLGVIIGPFSGIPVGSSISIGLGTFTP